MTIAVESDLGAAMENLFLFDCGKAKFSLTSNRSIPSLRTLGIVDPNFCDAPERYICVGVKSAHCGGAIGHDVIKGITNCCGRSLQIDVGQSGTPPERANVVGTPNCEIGMFSETRSSLRQFACI